MYNETTIFHVCSVCKVEIGGEGVYFSPYICFDSGVAGSLEVRALGKESKVHWFKYRTLQGETSVAVPLSKALNPHFSGGAGIWLPCRCLRRSWDVQETQLCVTGQI